MATQKMMAAIRKAMKEHLSEEATGALAEILDGYDKCKRDLKTQINRGDQLEKDIERSKKKIADLEQQIAEFHERDEMCNEILAREHEVKMREVHRDAEFASAQAEKFQYANEQIMQLATRVFSPSVVTRTKTFDTPVVVPAWEDPHNSYNNQPPRVEQHMTTETETETEE